MKHLVFCVLLLLPYAAYPQTIPPVTPTKKNISPHPRSTPQFEHKVLKQKNSSLFPATTNNYSFSTFESWT